MALTGERVINRFKLIERTEAGQLVWRSVEYRETGRFWPVRYWAAMITAGVEVRVGNGFLHAVDTFFGRRSTRRYSTSKAGELIRAIKRWERREREKAYQEQVRHYLAKKAYVERVERRPH